MSKIVAQNKQPRGYAVDIDCVDSALAYELAKQTELYIIGFADSDAKVTQLRKELDSAGRKYSKTHLVQQKK
ncbi:MAG: hypothetical protein H8D45_01530 [Bacteroidetes bacterium]|nr:hypothetical protein [Bacteroidota bacterium]